MANESDKASKKIIVDEDWKSRVEAEREAARRAESGGDAAAGAEVDSAAARRRDASLPLPPPDLHFVVTTFFVQALVALGITPNPATGKHESDLPQARHAIDVIEMLRRKTEGNRTAEETELLDDVLHKLRLAYVAATGDSGTARGEPT